MVARDWDTVVSKPGEFSMSTDPIDKKKKNSIKDIVKTGEKTRGREEGHRKRE